MKKIIKKIFNLIGYEITSTNRNMGLYKKIYLKNKKYTMIPMNTYINNLSIIERLLANVQGNIVECGVWRGGMIAGIAELLTDSRIFYLYDSFEGLPDAQAIDGEEALEWQLNKDGDYYFDNCKAEISYAEEAMKKTKVDFRIIKGWFNDTLPKNDCQDIALLRVDGDWYDSTMSILENLYPKVVHNGVVIIDDYFAWDGCSKAVHDYLSRISSTSRIRESDGVCFLVKKDFP